MDASINIENLQTQFLETLESFAAVQQRHLAELRAGRLQSFPVWRQEREQAFERLKSMLERLSLHLEAAVEPNLQFRLPEMMKEVLAGEADLEDATSSLRESMTGRLQLVRRGRKAVQGYILKEKTTLPRFLSSRS